jgi:hypothetical protein
LLKEDLATLDFADERLISEVLNEVGHQFANTEGPDFGALTQLSGLVLLGGDQVSTLMGKVREGIVRGVQSVVEELPMEKKYQRAALNKLADGMNHLTMQFEMYMDLTGGAAGGTTEGGFTGWWEPKPWDHAVCCMKGMECWTGKFAAAAGKATLEADLAQFEWELEDATAHFDELNAENLREQAEERAEALANSRILSNKLSNQVRDAETREAAARETLAGLSGAELTAAEGKVETLAAETKTLKDRRAAEEGSYAQLEREDAELRVESL